MFRSVQIKEDLHVTGVKINFTPNLVSSHLATPIEPQKLICTPPNTHTHTQQPKKKKKGCIHYQIQKLKSNWLIQVEASPFERVQMDKDNNNTFRKGRAAVHVGSNKRFYKKSWATK